MPAFNAEKYISQAIESILGQTYQNIELTVVDDGSTDGTLGILQSFAERDNRVKILSTDNSGPANARNFALDSLDGSSDFVMFCDADDTLEPNMVEKAVKEAENGADFVIMGFTIIDADGTESKYCEEDRRLDSDTMGTELGKLYKANLLNQVWGKLFRSDIIYESTIRFPDYRWGEDRFFVFDYLSHSYNVSVLSYCGYRYYMHPGQSLITSFLENKADICILIDERMEELCRKYNVDDDTPFRYMFAKSIFSCFANLFSPNCMLTRREKRKYIKKIINDANVLRRIKGADGSPYIKIVTWVIECNSVTVNMIAAAFTAFFSRLLPNSFRKIKHIK